MGTFTIDEKLAECNRLKKRLPSELIDIQLDKDGETVYASLFEYPEGYRWWDVFKLSNLPNNLINTDDLIRFRLNLVNQSTLNSLL